MCQSCIVYAVFLLQVCVPKVYPFGFDHFQLQFQIAWHLLMVSKEKINNSLLSNSLGSDTVHNPVVY